MQHWQKHLQIALLGTTRAPWSPAELPAPVRQQLPARDGDDAAAVFLDATALLYAYAKSGARTTTKAEDLVPEAPEDVLPFCKPAAIQLWRRIRALESNNPALEMRWLQRCHGSNYVLAPDLLPDVLALGTQKKMAQLKPYIARVAGARGRWLAGLFPEWAYILQADVQQVWAAGKASERAEAFRQFRKDQPEEALQMLRSTWDKESAADRKRFLELLLPEISAADMDFLLEIRAVYAADTGSKAVVMETKRWITRLLLLIPESALRQEWQKALQPYFKLLTNGRIMLSLPVGEDAFFNQQNLTVQSGFPVTGKGETAISAWLNTLAIWIPPAVWADAVNAGAGKTLEALCHFPEVRAHLIQASIDNRDSTFAETLLDYTSGTNWNALLGVLPEDRREAFIMGDATVAIKMDWASPALHFRWSPGFSTWVLRQLYDSWIGYYFHRIQQIMPLDVYLHPSVKSDAIPELYDQAMKRERWMELIVPELEKTRIVSYEL